MFLSESNFKALKELQDQVKRTIHNQSLMDECEQLGYQVFDSPRQQFNDDVVSATKYTQRFGCQDDAGNLRIDTSKPEHDELSDMSKAILRASDYEYDVIKRCVIKTDKVWDNMEYTYTKYSSEYIELLKALTDVYEHLERLTKFNDIIDRYPAADYKKFADCWYEVICEDVE